MSTSTLSSGVSSAPSPAFFSVLTAFPSMGRTAWSRCVVDVWALPPDPGPLPPLRPGLPRLAKLTEAGDRMRFTELARLLEWEKQPD
ncbi:hypothetical protein ACIGV8_29000 [Streptomyces albidoflavus]